MNENLKQKVFNIIENETDIKISNLDPDKDIYKQITLDSVHFVGITARLEKELGIQLPISVMEVSTINEFLAVVEKELEK